MIDNLKDLEKLLKLCRKQGVTDIKLGSVELKLGDLPTERTEASTNVVPTANPFANFPDRILTEEELLFYSSGGTPEDAPTQEPN